MNLSQKIKQLRLKKNLSQKELGESVNVGESFISKIESGKKYPSRETITKLSKSLEVPVAYLLEESFEIDLLDELIKVKNMLLTNSELSFNNKPLNEQAAGILLEGIDFVIKQTDKVNTYLK
ncbi:helix-turn-helix transcriptional regulator [Bacillus sp. S13(2024)]|uniref:helix-turn-helix domain-containing protein n=1 Tax=Bacillus sp. S13(2024) TaxID=3162885 RepID=UPI003D2122FB